MSKRLLILFSLIAVSILVVVILAQRLNLFASLPLPFNSNPNGVGSCGFLEEKYCSQGKVEEVSIYGRNFDVIGFKLPEGTNIKIPFNGNIVSAEYTDESEFPLKGNFAIVNKLDKFTDAVFIVGDINFPVENELTRKAGEIIGTVTGNSKTNLNGYNVIMVPAVDKGQVIEPNMDLFREFFD